MSLMSHTNVGRKGDVVEKCEYLMMLASTRDVDLSVASPPWPSSEEVVGGWQVGNGNTEYGVLLRVQYRVVDGVVSDAVQNPLHESENARSFSIGVHHSFSMTKKRTDGESRDCQIGDFTWWRYSETEKQKNFQSTACTSSQVYKRGASRKCSASKNFEGCPSR
jgi:hypothetical protein